MSGIELAKFGNHTLKSVTYIAILAGTLGRVARQDTKRVQKVKSGTALLANTPAFVVILVWRANVADIVLLSLALFLNLLINVFA